MDLQTHRSVRDCLAKLSLCRTWRLGGRKFECQDCGDEKSLYNSCGDRHCPQCSGGKRVDFHDRASQLITGGVVYYQVVFTLPSEVSELALSNRMLLSELLPAAAWSCLAKSIREEQGYRPAGLSVLHTWNQQLESHWHVHVLVAGEGPSLDGKRWAKATPPEGHRCGEGFYLVDSEKLKSRFSKSVRRRLAAARASGRLTLRGRFESLVSSENWTAFENHLRSKRGVVYVQPPPREDAPAETVVKYLTRYLSGGPISDRRIMRFDYSSVTFLARQGDRTGGEREQVEVTLSLEEFTKRWSQHIQPHQLTKTRYFGGWSNTQRADYMRLCRSLRDESEEADQQTVQEESIADDEQTQSFGDLICDACGSDRLMAVQTTSKPSWREIFAYGSDQLPSWYETLREEDDRLFWDGAMGEGFNDWYLETFVEGAKEITSGPPPPRQLDLFEPGNESGYLIDSF